MSWAAMNFGLFKIIYQFTGSIGRGTGWHEDEFFIFLGTIWIINCIIQTFFMANAEEFSEMIRTGGLDFALLKPIDRNLAADGAREAPLYISVWNVFPFVFYVLCGAAVMYSVMIVLASTSVWLGRNQNLYTQFLSLSDGDLSAQRHRYGAVGYIHICGADSGGVQRSGARAGSTDGAAVAQLGGRICDRSDAGKSVRQPKNLCLVAVDRAT